MNQPVIHVMRGELTDDELAALAAVLVARAADDPHTPGRRPARWRRLERQRHYRSPVSWR